MAQVKPINLSSEIAGDTLNALLRAFAFLYSLRTYAYENERVGAPAQAACFNDCRPRC